MLKSKKISSIVVCIAFILSIISLSACGNVKTTAEQTSQSASTSQAKEQSTGGNSDNAIAGTQGEISFVHFDANPLFTQAVDMYNKSHPGIIVKEQSIPYTNYATWVKTQLTGGTAPEVLFVESANDYKSMDLIISLNDYLAKSNPYSTSGKTWKEDFVQPYVDAGVDSSGSVNMVPWTCFVLGVFYNKDAFDQAGVQPPKTWEEWVKVNQKLKDTFPDKTPWSMAVKPNDAQTDWLLSQMLAAVLRSDIPNLNLRHKDGWSFDANNPLSIIGEVLTPDEKMVGYKKGLLDPVKNPAYADIFKLLKQMTPFWGKDFLAVDGKDTPNNFLSGSALQFYNGTWMAGGIDATIKTLISEGKAQKAFKWGMFPVPPVEGDQNFKAGNIQQLTGLRNGFAIKKTADANKTKIAVDFAQYITSQKIAKELMSLKDPKTGAFYNSDMSVVDGVPANDMLTGLSAKQKYADMAFGRMVYSQLAYDQEDFDSIIANLQMYLGDKLSEDKFLKSLSDSNFKAINRLLKSSKDQIDQKWMDEQLAQIK